MRRVFDSNILTDSYFDSLSLTEQRCYLGLILTAEATGCFEADPKALKKKIFADPKYQVGEKRMAEMLEKFIRDGKLRPYGGRYLYIVNFHKYQAGDKCPKPQLPLYPGIHWEPYPSTPRLGKLTLLNEENQQITEKEPADNQPEKTSLLSNQFSTISKPSVNQHITNPEKPPSLCASSEMVLKPTTNWQGSQSPESSLNQENFSECNDCGVTRNHRYSKVLESKVLESIREKGNQSENLSQNFPLNEKNLKEKTFSLAEKFSLKEDLEIPLPEGMAEAPLPATSDTPPPEPLEDRLEKMAREAMRKKGLPEEEIEKKLERMGAQILLNIYGNV